MPNRVGSPGIIIRPPMVYPVEVKATANDPVMQVSVSNGMVNITGVATNRGIVASFALFEVAGKKISIPLNRGMTGAQVLSALTKKLPSGYSIQGTASSFQVMKDVTTKPSSIEQINSIFQNALRADSPGKGRVTTAELRAAFKAGLEGTGKLSAQEKKAIANSWAATFTGAGFLATPAAQKEYARLAKKYALPTVPVM